jgi:hypothetical protein
MLPLCLTNSALRHKGIWGSGRIDPHFLDLGTSWRWVVSFTPWPLYIRGNLDRRRGGPQSRSGPRGEEKILDPTGTRSAATYKHTQSKTNKNKLRGFSPQANCTKCFYTYIYVNIFYEDFFIVEIVIYILLCFKWLKGPVCIPVPHAIAINRDAKLGRRGTREDTQNFDKIITT